MRILVASSNPGKLREYQALAASAPALPGKHDSAPQIALELLPEFENLPAFAEDAPTFTENAAGKALHYSRFAALPVIADDSGLCVEALGGAPGVHSARYAGDGAPNAERIARLLDVMRGIHGSDARRAKFICVLAMAQAGRAIAVVSADVHGTILEAPRGTGGFGYDPLFFYARLGKTFAELTPEEKNPHSHRGHAFARLLAFLAA